MDHKPYSLLLVEDDASLGYLLTEYLKMKGMDLVWVKKTREVLPLLEQRRFDLLILDVMMPEMDGWTVLQQIRSMPVLSDTPVLVCSVFDDPELAYSLGAEYFLAKPFTRNDLLAALYKIGVINA